MANYIFENLTQTQAASFTSSDYLIFSTSSTTARSVTVAPAVAPSGSTAPAGTDYGVTISDGSGHSFTFPSDALSTASKNSHLVFNDQSTIIIGSNTAADTGTTGTLTSTSTAATSSASATTTVVYGLGGNDSIVGGQGNDYLYGGTGADTIVAQNGNNHIYGNALGVTSGTLDGNDSITAGTGSNYINGNAGLDTIVAGTTASNTAAVSTTVGAYNRVFGGADNDTITINGNASSIAAVNGNTGNDTITDNSYGTNTLRGGQGADTITLVGGAHDVIMGDAGADRLVVNTNVAGHVAVLTGGADADVFDFGTAGAGAVAHLSSTGQSVAAGTAGSTNYYQEITDFTQGTDTIHLTFTTPATSSAASGAVVGYSGTTFNSVADAQAYASTLIGSTNTSTGGTINVASLNVHVGNTTDTYLFYNDTTGTSPNTTTTPGVIHLDGVTASTVTSASFG